MARPTSADILYDLSLGVWQTEHCVRCGACCYLPGIDLAPGRWKVPHTSCPYLTIDRKKGEAFCGVYGVRPTLCRQFFCDDFSLPVRVMAVRLVLDDFKVRPVENAEEIRAILERLA